MKSRSRITLALASLLLCGAAKADTQPAGYMVIVNAAVKNQTASKDEVRALFAKKVTRWSDDVLVTPFDLAPTNPARAQFSEGIHGKSPQAVLQEWRRLIFTGTGTPPREVKDDAAMIAAVAATPGSIGYVKAGTALPPQVHSIAVKDD